MINFVIVTHGEFGAYLVEAAEAIVGAQPSGVRVLSISARLGIAEMRQRVDRAVESLSGGNGLIVFTDMRAGTPVNVAFPAIRDRKGVEMISGVNLAMLVSAFSYRASLPLDKLTEKVVQSGRDAVCDFRRMLAGRRVG